MTHCQSQKQDITVIHYNKYHSCVSNNSLISGDALYRAHPYKKNKKDTGGTALLQHRVCLGEHNEGWPSN